MDTKTCSKCKTELPLDNNHFYYRKRRKDGFGDRCKECWGRSLNVKPITKEGYKICFKCKKELPETKEYFWANKKLIGGFSCWCKACAKEYNKNYKLTKETPEQVEKRKIYMINYQPKWTNDKRASSVEFKIMSVLRCRVAQVIRGNTKSGSTSELLGCSIEFFLRYIESLFECGMNWKNFGRGDGKWSLDHIRPCCSFDNITDPKQQRECFHYTNLQPMWYVNNSAKGSFYKGVQYRYKKTK